MLKSLLAISLSLGFSIVSIFGNFGNDLGSFFKNQTQYYTAIFDTYLGNLIKTNAYTEQFHTDAPPGWLTYRSKFGWSLYYPNSWSYVVCPDNAARVDFFYGAPDDSICDSAGQGDILIAGPVSADDLWGVQQMLSFPQPTDLIAPPNEYVLNGIPVWQYIVDPVANVSYQTSVVLIENMYFSITIRSNESNPEETDTMEHKIINTFHRLSN